MSGTIGTVLKFLAGFGGVYIECFSSVKEDLVFTLYEQAIIKQAGISFNI